MRRGRKIAKVAMARKLAVHLYWMWREGWDYVQWKKFGSPPAREILEYNAAEIGWKLRETLNKFSDIHWC